jgi:hypothetical protein
LQAVLRYAYNFSSSVLNLNISFDGGSYTDLKFILVDKERFPYVGKERYFPNIIYCSIGYDYKLKQAMQYGMLEFNDKMSIRRTGRLSI